ncbi:MAG: diguanylate cyclase [Deltaproteobacteria bacterium]|nr:diguanylate cyclase [Deltaproteobacteria bacterium]
MPPDGSAEPNASRSRLSSELESYRAELEVQNDELRQAQVSLELSQRKYYQLFDLAPIGYVLLRQDGVVLESNLAAARLLGSDRAMIEGRRLAHQLVGADMGAFAAHLQRVFDLPGRHRLEVRIKGNKEPLHLRLDSAAVDAVGYGDTVCMTTLFDVTRERRSESEARALAEELSRTNRLLKDLANRDPLTKLFNRRGLEEQLARDLARTRRERDHLTAVLVDCDQFKAVNDALGHTAGDVVLCEVGMRLRQSVRPTDAVGRIGGDEFLVLLPDTPISMAGEVAQRLRLAIGGEAFLFDGAPRRVTVSIGVSEVDASVSALEEVIAATQQALSTSKRAGRNRVSTTNEQIVAQSAWDREVDIVSYAQPIMRTSDGVLVGYEMLTRAADSTLGFSATDLFRAAADAGRLTSFDLKCLRLSAQVMRSAPAGLELHVNVLPSTLLNTPAEEILAILQPAAEGHVISLEISEQQLIGDPTLLVGRLAPLRSAGFKVVMDDLGFGRTSLESLIMLEPQSVKIDRALVSGVGNDPTSCRALKRLLKVVRSLDLPAVAEGVENKQDLDLLAAFNVPFVQGHYLGPPRPCPW